MTLVQSRPAAAEANAAAFFGSACLSPLAAFWRELATSQPAKGGLMPTTSKMGPRCIATPTIPCYPTVLRFFL
jgi:hypothetical protein